MSYDVETHYSTWGCQYSRLALEVLWLINEVEGEIGLRELFCEYFVDNLHCLITKVQGLVSNGNLEKWFFFLLCFVSYGCKYLVRDMSIELLFSLKNYVFFDIVEQN